MRFLKMSTLIRSIR